MTGIDREEKGRGEEWSSGRRVWGEEGRGEKRGEENRWEKREERRGEGGDALRVGMSGGVETLLVGQCAENA